MSIESSVCYYPTAFPDVFDRAEGSFMYSRQGKRYIDFYSGSSSVNYGHNPPPLRRALLQYFESGGIVTAMDLDTAVRRVFMERFEEIILHPRRLPYRVMSPGPSGTSGVEAALTLARKVTGRRNVFAFHGAYHGMGAGSLAATGDFGLRAQAGSLPPDVTFFPFDDGYVPGLDSIAYMEAVLSDPKSGVAPPAAVIVETVQGEAGVFVASKAWLERLGELCAGHKILLIVDDVQVGVGRTGPFFSFERCRMVPDIVVLSKSLSGCGLPLTLVLFREDLDVWRPGDYKGTFRGIQPAFASATAALEHYWRDDRLQRQVAAKGEVIGAAMASLVARFPSALAVRGIGMMWGLCATQNPASIERIARQCFERALLVEISGRRDSVLKLTPPLTMPDETLAEALEILSACVDTVLRA
jgi:diaminobutyrate-2-oxoglutarate transaminase